MQDFKTAFFPIQTPQSPTKARWKPYEGQPFWSIEPYRNKLLFPAISKRHFILPQLNRVGLTIPELIIASIIFAAAVKVGYGQRTLKAETAGHTANLLGIPLFLFITYRSIVTWLYGISFERAMFWHGFFAWLFTTYAMWHGLCAMYWAERREDEARGLQSFVSGAHQHSFITGASMSFCLILLIVTSLHPVRRRFRRAWLGLHHALVVPVAVLSVLHGASFVVVGLAIYFVDRLFGYLYQAHFQYSGMGQKGTAEVLPSGLVRLSFPRLASFTAGQFMCVHVASVSRFEYHAFSIASIPSDNQLTFLIQPEGVWSRNLAKKVRRDAAETSTSLQVPLQARLHGPIGRIALDWQSNRYQAFILVAGGSGISPLIAIYRHLAEQRRRGRQLALVQLIWSARHKQLVHDVVDSQIRSKGLQRPPVGKEEENATAVSEIEVEIFLTGRDEDECQIATPGVEAKIFLTRETERMDYPRYADRGSKENEALGNVQWNTGRPNLRDLFTANRNVAERGNLKRIAVLACGPDVLTRDVCGIARRVSGGDVHFDVHLEHFG